MKVDQEEQIKSALRRLARFDPTCKDAYGNQVKDYLVLDALAAHGQLKVTAQDVKIYLKQTFLLDFEEPEINASP